MSSGNLTVGGTMSSAYYILPVICGEFYRKHPNISITIDMSASDAEIRKKTVDLMLSFTPNTAEYEALPLLEERLVVAIHKKHPQAERIADYAVPYQQLISRNIAPEREISDVSLFQDIPFIKTGKEADADRRLAMMIENHKTSRCIVANAKTFDMRYRIMQEGLGALLVSDLFVANFPHNKESIYYFALKDLRSYRKLYIQRKKNLVKNEILDKFITTAVESCRNKDLFRRMQTNGLS